MNREKIVQILQTTCQQYEINPDELRTSRFRKEIYIGKNGEPKSKKISFATIKASRPKRNKRLSPQAKILQILRGKS